MEAPRQPRSGHPVAAAVACVHEALDAVADAPVWSLSEAEAGAALLDLGAEIDRLQELRLRVAAHAHSVEVGDAVGATSTANWWAHQSRLTRPETHRLMRLARALDNGHHDGVRSALGAGRIHLDQAQVIVEAVEDLPEDFVDEEIRAKAEEFLLEQAGEHDAITLRRLAKRLVEVAAPEQADAAEAARLEREEAAARAAARLTMSDDGHGKTHGRFTIPTHHAAMLRAALLAIAAPKHQHAVNGAGAVGAERRPGPERMGQAFCEFLERYPTDRLPDAGGVAATIVVTMTLESLLGGLRAAHLHTGETISATEARRLACQAGIVPAVLDGAGPPARRRPQAPLPHQDPPRRPRAARRRLHRRRMRLAARPVPRPPRRPLVPRRCDQRGQRPAPVSAAPRPSPRPRLRDQAPPRREAHLPPPVLDRASVRGGDAVVVCCPRFALLSRPGDLASGPACPQRGAKTHPAYADCG